MDPRLFATVFVTVFLAELGDKTQLATVLYAAEGDHPRLTVFAAASAALIVSTALGVLGGAALSQVVSGRVLQWIAGAGFIGVGLWILIGAREV
jgi:putative Ca2+/H+ antiporter (TMEM165/GDT1 family)